MPADVGAPLRSKLWAVSSPFVLAQGLVSLSHGSAPQEKKSRGVRMGHGCSAMTKFFSSETSNNLSVMLSPWTEGPWPCHSL